MLALARLWTWVGNLFIPIAIGWAVYVRNGLADRPPPIGVLVSRAYWGVAVSLAAGAVLMWAIALYVRLAKRKNALYLVPPNTTFEDETARSRIISWSTVTIFAISVITGLTVFGVRYAESHIHKWADQQPLQSSFWGSRAKAHEAGCSKQPCFAVEQRVDASNTPIFGVNEYILYITDGALIAPALLILAGAIFLSMQVFSSPPSFKYEL
jgi:hypothetical protein